MTGMLRRTLILALAPVAVAWAQAGPAVESGTVFRTDARIVVCHTTVVNREGRLVTNLPKEAFSVYEDSVAQEIKVFKREDIPVSIGLIIDNSGSMRDKRARVEAAALALVKESNPDDEVFIVNFSDEASFDNVGGKAFTSDVREMEQALKRIDSRGATAMRDALRMAIDHLKSKGRKEKRVLVVVTDGADNESLVTQQSLMKAAIQSEVLIYSVGLLSEERPAEAEKAKAALTELSVNTGGEAFYPAELSEVDRIAHQVARDIRNQYTIEYTPANAAMDGTFRKIEVKVDNLDLTVRTRKGYYASSDAAPAARRK
jgi:Ca-activated chloride channel homolog